MKFNRPLSLAIFQDGWPKPFFQQLSFNLACKEIGPKIQHKPCNLWFKSQFSSVVVVFFSVYFILTSLMSSIYICLRMVVTSFDRRYIYTLSISMYRCIILAVMDVSILIPRSAIYFAGQSHSSLVMTSAICYQWSHSFMTRM